MNYSALFLPLLMVATPALAQDFLPGMLVVKFNDATSLAEAGAIVSSYVDYSSLHPAFPDTEMTRKAGLDCIFIVLLPEDEDVAHLSQAMALDERFTYVEPDYILTVDADPPLPNDGRFHEQWALHNTGQTGGAPDADVDYPEALTLEAGDPGTVVAVIDTGADLTHGDLVGQLWVNPEEDINGNGIPDFFPAAEGGDLDGIDQDEGTCYFTWLPDYTDMICIDDLVGYDFIGMVNPPSDCTEADCADPDNLPTDGHGHGTATAGQVGAATDNSMGIAGMCPDCRVMIVRACYQTWGPGNCSIISIVQGIYYAVTQGADVISMSFGSTFPSGYMHDALIFAYQQGVTLAASAGNDNSGDDHFPSGFDEVISVAATDDRDFKATFSNWAPTVDVAAPGVSILSTRPGGTYGSSSGTSRAAPHAAGLAGLLLSACPSLSPDEVKDILIATADQAYGFEDLGRINAFAALEATLATSQCIVGACCLEDGTCVLSTDADCSGKPGSAAQAASPTPAPCPGTSIGRAGSRHRPGARVSPTPSWRRS